MGDWDYETGKWIERLGHYKFEYSGGRLTAYQEYNPNATDTGVVKDDVMKFSYDVSGRVTKVIAGDYNNEKSPYREEGLLEVKYGSNGRMAQITVSDNDKVNPECEDTQTNPCKRHWVPDDRYDYSYDGQQRMVRMERFNLGEDGTAELSRRVVIAYDAQGRLDIATTSYEGSEGGALEESDRTTYTWGSGNRIEKVERWSKSVGYCHMWSTDIYTTAADGRVLEYVVSDSAGKGEQQVYSRRKFEYDALNRLVAVVRESHEGGTWTPSSKATFEISTAGTSYTFERFPFKSGTEPLLRSMRDFYGRMVVNKGL